MGAFSRFRPFRTPLGLRQISRFLFHLLHEALRRFIRLLHCTLRSDQGFPYLTLSPGPDLLYRAVQHRGTSSEAASSKDLVDAGLDSVVSSRELTPSCGLRREPRYIEF